MNNKKNGFTFIELMLVLLIFSIVMTIVYTALSSYQTQSKAQKNLLLMDENIKTGLYILTNYIQMAGFGCSYSLDKQNQTINQTYNRVFTPVDSDTNGADRLTVVLGNRFIGYVADDDNTNLSSCYKNTRIYVAVDSSSKINLINSDLKKYIFIDRNPYNSFFIVTQAPSPASINTCPSGYSCYSVTINNSTTVCDNDSVYSIRAITISYDYVDQQVEINENVGGNSYPLISCVETLQFQYGIDSNKDGVLSSGEFKDSFTKSEEKYLKLVKVYLLIRTKEPDPKFKDSRTTYNVANYTINLDTNDSNGIDSEYDWHYRRRVIELNIVPRNMLTGY